jgi:LysR family transcriptional regulator, glycine cleavage system transcriptional activator
MRTFEAVARNLSFTQAADELALTQSAVSHQIRALEDHLGTRLFRRLHRGIELTIDGRAFLEGTRAGLDSILLASERIRNQHRVGVLTVGVPAAFAIWWLVPRLGRFAALHPEIEIRIATIDGREPDLWRDGIDVAVVKRPAKAAAHHKTEMPLLREIVFPVCSPSLLNGEASSLRNPSELKRLPLIEFEAAESEDREFGWSTWLNRFGLNGVPEPRRLRFSNFGVALSAAVDGLGVALGRSPMADAELAAGRLVRPFPKRVVAKASEVFALAWRDSGGRQDQRIAAFRDFALDEACGCELAAGPCGMPASERDSSTRATWMAGRAAKRAMIAARQ